MSIQKAIRYHEYGKPREVLRIEDISIPEPGKGEVLVRMDFSAINPSDYGMIEGSYGSLRDLPAVAGREGVGTITELGSEVTLFQCGQCVRFPGEMGAWQRYAIVEESSLLLVPHDIPMEQAAVSFINPPTAYCLLNEIVDLKPEDWVLQNAGNSAVGLSIIQMAKARGIRTISQVRRAELIEPLKEMGADEVVVEGSGWGKGVQELTGGASIALALNSIGGESAMDQIKVLSDGGTQVTFGGMVGDFVRFPTRYLIFNNVRLVGFWWDQWVKRKGPAARAEIMNGVYDLMRRGTLKIPIEAVYSLDEIQEAITHDKQPRLGKVLLRP